MKQEYRATIGLEIHAELKTKSKMFCGCKNDPHHGEANTLICPVCTAQPGTLPVVNKEAVHSVLLVGAAVGGTLADFSEFDRKNYFYPDIPKAYQISQYKYPLVTGGQLNGVSLTRIHLEEDTAKNVHDATAGSLVDFNRSGVPLMELVTEPVIHDAKTAGNFARELQLLLRILGVSEANMEKGEMRVEANISVSPTDEFGTKVEVKNLNSFRSVEGAITFEIERQIMELEAGKPIVQETRGWDENKLCTFSQRVKETANDYRYFPDPDIVKFKLSEVENISRINEKIPKLATELRSSWLELGVSEDQIETIITNDFLRSFFTKITTSHPEIASISSNYLTTDVLSVMSSRSSDISDQGQDGFVKLMELLSTSKINSRVAKDLIPEVVFDGVDPEIIIKERSLGQLSSLESLLPVIDEVINEFSSVVDEYKAGKEASIQFLVGQVMKKTKGAANPKVAAEALLERIK